MFNLHSFWLAHLGDVYDKLMMSHNNYADDAHMLGVTRGTLFSTAVPQRLRSALSTFASRWLIDHSDCKGQQSKIAEKA